ncbi:hypothetical protein [Streptomyces sp. NPDC060243]|uniref:hypothetical protein n=1 Tax=Streptomyces sp. NPDC060243 TaxID=3347081 RepID=UPI00365C115B
MTIVADQPQDLPDWRNPVIPGMNRPGGRVRVALWLVSEVGEGNPFTKTELRAAFPDESQIDRRLRDLRDWGWVIHNNRDDESLRPEEQRLVKCGVPVWIPHQERPQEVGAKSALNAAERTRILSADDHMCRSCGIAAGEEYEDGFATAKLVLSRRDIVHRHGPATTTRVTLCERCAKGGLSQTADVAGFLSAVEQLSPLERRAFARWVEAGKRARGEMERLWGLYGTLPADARREILRDLASGTE